MNKEIELLIGELQVMRVVKTQLAELKKKRNMYFRRKLELDKEVQRLDKSINRLSGASFLSIYKRIVGKQKNLLELTKKHYMEMCIELIDLEKSLELLDFEISVLKEKIVSEYKLENKLKTLIQHQVDDTLDRELKEYKRLILKINKKSRIVKRA